METLCFMIMSRSRDAGTGRGVRTAGRRRLTQLRPVGRRGRAAARAAPSQVLTPFCRDSLSRAAACSPFHSRLQTTGELKSGGILRVGQAMAEQQTALLAAQSLAKQRRAVITSR